MTFSTLSILLPATIMLHVTEEFLFPGGLLNGMLSLDHRRQKVLEQVILCG